MSADLYAMWGGGAQSPAELVSARPQLLQQVMDALPFPIAVLTEAGQVLTANDAFSTLMEGVALPVHPLELLREDAGASYLGDRRFRVVNQALENGRRLLCLLPAAEQVDGALRARFLSVAAHDLRGALANVRSYGAILLSPKVQLGERALRAAQGVVRTADRALSLSQDFFDAIRQENEPMPLHAERMDPLPLLQQVSADVRSAAVERQVAFEAELPPTLPQVEVDVQRFTHLVRAFLEQALARSEAGDGMGMLAKATDGGLYVEVWDRGPVVSPADRGATFDYERRAIHERKLDVGFRLALARLEVEAHGGHAGIRVDGETTRYYFALPASAQAH